MSVSILVVARPRRMSWIVTGGWSLRVGLAGFTLIAVLALLAPWVAPYDPTALGLADGLQPPNRAHWFGTDQLGRDILTRVLYAARTDLQIGTIGVTIPLIIGAVLVILVNLLTDLTYALLDPRVSFRA